MSRRSNNPAGRPSTGVADAPVVLRLDPTLLRLVDACAAADGVQRSTWLRRAAHERCLRQAAADKGLLRLLTR